MRRWLIFIVLFLFTAGNLYPDRGKVDSTEEKDALNVTVKADGTLSISGKEYSHDGLKELLRERKSTPELQAPDGPSSVNYPLIVKADNATQYQHIQWLLMAAVRYGGITKTVFMDPDDKNRKYSVTFPKDKAILTTPILTLELKEIRIKLTTGEKDLTSFSIEKIKIGDFQSTGDKKGTEAAKVREENGKIGTSIADKVKELRKTELTMPVIIDAGEDVRWEHVLKIVEVLSPLDAKIEFAGNPKFKEMYK